MTYNPNPDRYKNTEYNRSGNSGLLLPPVSLGLWHNFGHVDDLETGRETLLTAFDRGIIHFDLANNYGPPPGSAEENFGQRGSVYVQKVGQDSEKRSGPVP